MNNSIKKKKDLETLNLKDDATNEDIKLAYRQMAKKTHPDLNKHDPEASRKFQRIKQAYNDLTRSKESNSLKRTPITQDFWNWGHLDSFFQEFLSNEVFFQAAGKKKRDVPISQPEPYVDLNELVKKKRSNQEYF